MKAVVASCIILLALLLICPHSSKAQSDTGYQKKTDSSLTAQGDQSAKEDEEFNLFLISIAGFFICSAIGVAMAGSIIAVLILLVVFGFLSAGIISISVVAGFYRRSFQYGFKTFVVLLSMFAGTIIGAFGLLIIPRLLGMTITVQKSLIIGALGGAAGGIVMGFIIYQALKYSAIYFWKRYHHERSKQ